MCEMGLFIFFFISNTQFRFYFFCILNSLVFVELLASDLHQNQLCDHCGNSKTLKKEIKDIYHWIDLALKCENMKLKAQKFQKHKMWWEI